MGHRPLSSQNIAKPNLQYYDRHCPEKTKLRRLLQALGRQGRDSQSEGAEASAGEPAKNTAPGSPRVAWPGQSLRRGWCLPIYLTFLASTRGLQKRSWRTEFKGKLPLVQNIV